MIYDGKKQISLNVLQLYATNSVKFQFNNFLYHNNDSLDCRILKSDAREIRFYFLFRVYYHI